LDEARTLQQWNENTKRHKRGGGKGEGGRAFDLEGGREADGGSRGNRRRRDEIIQDRVQTRREQQGREVAERGLERVAEAMTRETSEAQRGRREAEDIKKDEVRKLDEERQKHAEAGAARKWEDLRQEEFRKKRQEEEQRENQQDSGRTLERKPKPD
jgi:hypothetical protein